jgi:putative peptide zinc metalloprotease protein
MYGGPPHASIPCRPPGVEPAGRLRGSGFAERQWLVRRDRQFVQVGDLLYRLVELVDGERTHEDIARELTESTRWHVTSEDVEVILKTRLAPLGLVVDEEAGVARPPMGGSPLLRNARLRVLGPGPIDHVARILRHLYRWPALLAALLVIGITQFWLFAEGDPNEAVQQVIATPLSLPLIAGLLLVAGVFHEFGHGAALRRRKGTQHGRRRLPLHTRLLYRPHRELPPRPRGTCPD